MHNYNYIKNNQIEYLTYYEEVEEDLIRISNCSKVNIKTRIKKPKLRNFKDN